MAAMAPVPFALAVLGAALGVSAIDNGLGLSPPMGWSANNAWHWVYGQDVMEASCTSFAIARAVSLVRPQGGWHVAAIAAAACHQPSLYVFSAASLR